MLTGIPKTANPQGKGLVPILQAVSSHHIQIPVSPKLIDQVEMELFTSMFVLQSDIKFNPVVGRAYWLYQENEIYKLSLIAPEEWLRPHAGRFIGECVLQEDRTWTLVLSTFMAEDQVFLQMIENRRKEFLGALQKAKTLEEALPDYNFSLPFYAKLLTYALARSLKVSMQLSGIQSLTYQEAKGMLNHQTSKQ